MAKKKEEDKRTKMIKILVTERFYKKINRYAGIVFQNKSEFVRTAIRHRIAEINNSIFSIPMDRKYKDQNLRRSVIKEIEDVQKNGDYLQKPSEDSLKTREEEKKKRKAELENEKKRLEKQLEIVKKNLQK